MFRNAISLKLVGTYGHSYSNVQWKKHPRSSPRTFLSWHTFLTGTMKSRQNAVLLSDETIFFPFRNIDKSVSTQCCQANLVSQKREENKSKFQMVNLGNGETKDFVELWEVMHLKIWTHFSIRQTKLFWITLKHYSQRPPMLSPSKQIPLQSLLCNTTTCLTRPATFILFSKWKKASLKQPLINYFCKKAPP